MAKKTISMILMVLIIGISGVSCGRSDVSQGELISSNTPYFIYKDLYFYRAETVEGNRDTSTLKFINLATTDEMGTAIYSDVLDEGGDPFCDQVLSPMVLVDEEKTAQNNGIPVLIAACPVNVESDDDYPEWYYRLISFNMATNQMKVLCDNIGDSVWEIALYRNTIYYGSFIGERDDFTMEKDGEYALFSLPKSGGKPERLPFPDLGTSFDFKCSYNGKLYIETHVGGNVYRCDPDGKNAEKVYSFTEKTQPVFYCDGYMYYQDNFHTVQREGLDMDIYDLYRCPLEKDNKLQEKNGELILKNVYAFIGCDGAEIYYFSSDEGNVFMGNPHDYSIAHYYNVETKEQGVLYDFSNEKGIAWTPWFVTKKYIIIDSFTEKFRSYWDYSVINRETGEHHNLVDCEWNY